MPLAGCELKVNSSSTNVDPVSTQVEFHESLDELTSVVIVLKLPPGYINRDKVAKDCTVGAEFELTFGSRTIKGDVVRVRYQTDPGMPEVWTLFGVETLHRARLIPASELSDKDTNTIVETLIKTAGLKGKASGTAPTAKDIVLHDSSALGLLKRIAADRNYGLVADGKGNVAFAPRGQKGDAVEVLHQECESLELVTDLTGVPIGVTVKGYDYRQKKGKEFIDYTTAEKDLASISGGDSAAKLAKSFGKKESVTVRTLHVKHLSDAKALAIGEFQTRCENFLRGRLVTGLVPDAEPAGDVEVTGAPWPLMGPFRIRSVRHVFGPGPSLQTELEFFSDGLPKA